MDDFRRLANSLNLIELWEVSGVGLADLPGGDAVAINLIRTLKCMKRKQCNSQCTIKSFWKGIQPVVQSYLWVLYFYCFSYF